MRKLADCHHSGCSLPALFARKVCLRHLEDPREYQAQVLKHLTKEHRFEHENFSGVTLTGVDLSGKEFLHCLLTGSTCDRVAFTECRLSLVYMDFSSLVDCRFDGSCLSATVLAGSNLERCSFRGCEMPRSNFVGARCIETTFDESDLSSSRFIGATLEQVGMRDCNLYHVHFEHAQRTGVEMAYSNTGEAHL